MRVDGKFVDSEGNRPEGQLVRLPRAQTCAWRLTVQNTGAAVSPSTLLWSVLSSHGVKRADFGGADAYCQRTFSASLLYYSELTQLHKTEIDDRQTLSPYASLLPLPPSLPHCLPASSLHSSISSDPPRTQWKSRNSADPIPNEISTHSNSLSPKSTSYERTVVSKDATGVYRKDRRFLMRC